MAEDTVELGRRIVKMLREAEALVGRDREKALQLYREAVNAARSAGLYKPYLPIIRKLRAMVGSPQR